MKCWNCGEETEIGEYYNKPVIVRDNKGYASVVACPKCKDVELPESS